LQVKIMHAEPEPLSANARADIPEALEHLVMQCLKKNPQDRPAHVSGIMVTLEQLALSVPWGQAQAGRWWHDYEAARDHLREQAN
jgi:serine/threonine-protein kinase